MSAAAIVFFVLLGLGGVLAVALMVLFNRLVEQRNRFKNAFAQIDVQLRRRYDLIPNLVETAKGYLKHERETLEAVIAARNQARDAEKKARQNPGDASAMLGLMGAESTLGSALGRLFALVESYPELKADETVAQLSEEITSTENKIAFARQAFNDAVMFYNNARETFPGNVVAAAFNFTQAQLLELDEPRVKEAPRVSF